VLLTSSVLGIFYICIDILNFVCWVYMYFNNATAIGVARIFAVGAVVNVWGMGC